MDSIIIKKVETVKFETENQTCANYIETIWNQFDVDT